MRLTILFPCADSKQSAWDSSSGTAHPSSSSVWAHLEESETEVESLRSLWQDGQDVGDGPLLPGAALEGQLETEH